MHRFRKWALALAVGFLATWVLPARPAEEKDEYVPDEGAVEVILLRHKAVQKELKLTKEEKGKVLTFTSKQWQKALKLLKESEKKREAAFDEMKKENEKFLEDTLTAAQRKRLQQITMQVAGLLTLGRPEIAKELKLTDAQKKKVHELHLEARKRLHAALHTGKKEDREEMLAAARKKAREALEGLLTDEQKKEWKKMLGEEFKGDLSKD